MAGLTEVIPDSGIHTLDYHTGGEPLRIVTSGLPDIPGATMLQRRRYMSEHLDAVRRFLMWEPRGHADMYGAVLTPPATADGDVGVLFMHNEGYSTMCGHGIIALVTAGLEHDLFPVRDAGDIRIDTPAGRVVARARLDAGGVEEVAFENVASFVLTRGIRVNAGNRSGTATVAFGGAFYAYVDAADFGFELRPEEAPELITTGRQVKKEVTRQLQIRHPEGDADLNFLYGTIFVRGAANVRRSRNVCIFADGELDRSPTGTGVCGRVAIHHALGDIGLNDEISVESIVGSCFRGRALAVTRVGSLDAVIPEVTGKASQSGRQHFILQPDDPLGGGFLIR